MIEEDRIDLGLLGIAQHLGGGVDVGGAAHPPAGAGADGGDEAALGGLVVDQQQAAGGIGPHMSPLGPGGTILSGGG